MAIYKKDSRKTRHSTQHHAWVLLDGGFAKRNCTILNLSSTGACVKLMDRGSVGSDISLALTGDVRKVTRCRIVWRKEAVIGVEFVERT